MTQSRDLSAAVEAALTGGGRQPGDGRQDLGADTVRLWLAYAAVRLWRHHLGVAQEKENAMKYVYKVIDSPVGKLKLVGNDDGLAAVLWENDNPLRIRLGATEEDNNHPVLVETERQLGEYFAGKRRLFSLKLNFIGTEFQKKVWNALLEIPFGATVSYAELAGRIGEPKSARAVGAANGKNPISIIGPCHRVIGSSGELTGFAGGLAVKKTLLELESGRKEWPA